MSRLIDRLKAEKNDERSAAEITYDLGTQLQASGNKEVFAQNPDFYKEFLEIKSSLRRPLGQEMIAGFSAALKDSLPESGYNALAAGYSLVHGGANDLIGADKFQGDSVTDF